MALTVRTKLLAELKVALEEISLLKRVVFAEARTLDISNVPLPALYWWDDRETITKKLADVAVSKMVLVTWVFVGLPLSGKATLTDLGSEILGEIHDAIMAATGASNIALKINSVTVQKLFPSDNLGVIDIEFEIEYAHPWGEAFNEIP